MTVRILVMEDEKPLADVIAQLLRNQRYEVDTVYDLKTSLTVILANMHILKSHPNDAISEQAR